MKTTDTLEHVIRHQLQVLVAALTPDWILELVPSLTDRGLERFVRSGIMPQVDHLELERVFVLVRSEDLELDARLRARVTAARRYARRARLDAIAWSARP